MLVRIWRTSFDPRYRAELSDYAVRSALPLLSTRPGNRGVLFFTDGDSWTTLTLWQDAAAIEALERDPEYRRIVEGIVALEILGEPQETHVFYCEGGALPAGRLGLGSAPDQDGSEPAAAPHGTVADLTPRT